MYTKRGMPLAVEQAATIVPEQVARRFASWTDIVNRSPGESLVLFACTHPLTIAKPKPLGVTVVRHMFCTIL